jgi:hypothetical protein
MTYRPLSAQDVRGLSEKAVSDHKLQAAIPAGAFFQAQRPPHEPFRWANLT